MQPRHPPLGAENGVLVRSHFIAALWEQELGHAVAYWECLHRTARYDTNKEKMFSYLQDIARHPYSC